MPLSDLIRTLNSPAGSLTGHYARSGLDQPFVAVDGRVFLHYANIRLESQFLPIVESRTGKTHGHAASLQAFGLSNRQPIAAEAVFVLPTDDAEFVYLDRLVRTLHALNYLTRPTRGNLLLQVHANRSAFRALLEGEPALARLRLQQAPRLTLRTSLRSATLKLWDEDNRRLVPFPSAGRPAA